MNCDIEVKSEDFFSFIYLFFWGWDGGWGLPICIRLFFVLMLYIKFQVPSSSGSLVLTEKRDNG